LGLGRQRSSAALFLGSGPSQQPDSGQPIKRGLGTPSRGHHLGVVGHAGFAIGVVILSGRSWALWVLGHPDAAIADSERALTDARDIGQAATLM
jgi:hypothetical protein